MTIIVELWDVQMKPRTDGRPDPFYLERFVGLAELVRRPRPPAGGST